MLRKPERPTLETLTEDVSRQIKEQIPKGKKTRYRAAIGGIPSELRRLYREFDELTCKPYCIFGDKGYGTSVVFSLKNHNSLKSKVCINDYGTQFQCRCLELVQDAPSIEISKMSKQANDTRISFGSEMKQMEMDKAEKIIASAIDSVGGLAKDGEVTFGVQMKDRRYRIPMSQEQIAGFALRFVRGDWRVQGDLHYMVRRQFNL